jgi:hypothetical protein
MADYTYLGETPVDVATHAEYSKYTASDWAMLCIYLYGAIDGAHHKQWVIDRVTRCLKGVVPVVTLATWSNGNTEYRYDFNGTSSEYEAFVLKCQDPDEDGVPQYDYDEGIAP